jgi:hypothetical protein
MRGGRTLTFAEPPASLPDVDDCAFYHVIDLPGVGTTDGGWDLRGRVDDYLGHVDFAGKRVLPRRASGRNWIE